jgi:hypothetical protein
MGACEMLRNKFRASVEVRRRRKASIARQTLPSKQPTKKPSGMNRLAVLKF